MHISTFLTCCIDIAGGGGGSKNSVWDRGAASSENDIDTIAQN